MQAAPPMVPRHLPGTSATRVHMVIAILFSAPMLVLLAFLSLVDTPWLAFLTRANTSQPPHWHLPWAVTLPAGYLTLSALGILVVVPPFVLFWIWRYRSQVLPARDVTDVPQVWWAIPWQARLQPPLLQRWLGQRRSELAVSLALLVVGVLLFVALVGVLFAAIVVSGRLLNQLDAQPCITHYGCRPWTDTLKRVLSPGFFAGLALGEWAWALWLHRLEITSGVWFRYGAWMGGEYAVLCAPARGDVRGSHRGAGAGLAGACRTVRAIHLLLCARLELVRGAVRCCLPPGYLAAIPMAPRVTLWLAKPEKQLQN
jgi:hypothetical protein